MKTVQTNSKKNNNRKPVDKKDSRCPYSRKCGACQMIDTPYDKQLRQKHAHVAELLEPYTKVAAFVGMDQPEHYRCKVHAVFTHDKKGNPLSGIYREGTHEVVPVDSCLLEDVTHHVTPLVYECSHQMHGFYRLLAVMSCQHNSLLNSFLCLDCKFVECHKNCLLSL